MKVHDRERVAVNRDVAGGGSEDRHCARPRQPAAGDCIPRITVTRPWNGGPRACHRTSRAAPGRATDKSDTPSSANWTCNPGAIAVLPCMRKQASRRALSGCRALRPIPTQPSPSRWRHGASASRQPRAGSGRSGALLRRLETDGRSGREQTEASLPRVGGRNLWTSIVLRRP